MTFGKRFLQALGVVALGALVCAPAFGQVNTRVVTAGAATTSTKIIPGGTASIDVRLDPVALGVGCFGACNPGATGLIGTAFRISQTAPPANGFFSITGRSFVGSPFNDTTSGTSDAVVLVPPSNLLDPSNNDNLGRSTIGLAPVVPPTLNTLAVNLTLTSSVATPLGTYTIAPLAGISFATDDALNDYSMGSTYDIIVGQTLTVTKSGTGTGTVVADSGLINCGAVCSDIYPGTVVTLTATPSAGSVFIGWSGGGCSGTGTCVVTVSAATTVNAQFDLGPQTLTVTIAGTGTGTVASAPAGIACAPTCSAAFPAASMVTLTATPGSGSTFTGWSGGGCSGTGTCVVTMNAAVSVTATFDLPLFTLTVTKSGFGSGTVTSSPAGINCGATCSASFPSTTVVTLTAVADAGKTFTGWSGGGCSGTGTCVVTIMAATTVNAAFGDVQAPTTTILTGPSNPSNVANPTFTFSADESPVTFRCSLDGAPAVICTSPYTVSVGNGPHTLTVQATDPAGNVGNLASYSWTAAGIIISNVPIPTLNEWMLVLLAMVLGTAGMLVRRRKN